MIVSRRSVLMTTPSRGIFRIIHAQQVREAARLGQAMAKDRFERLKAEAGVKEAAPSGLVSS